MVMGGFGTATAHAPSGMVATADHLASSAGVAMLRAGGTAVDAAVAAGAVLAVTNQHQCGMGGDLFALVNTPDGRVEALCGAGRAGSGADALQARVEGLDRLPATGDVRAVTIPGCVDGWIELHRRHGRLPLDQVLEAAITYAATGFPASPLLALMAPLVLELDGADDYLEPAMAAGGRLPPGTLLRRPGVATALEAISAHGRVGFYLGPFGEGLLALGDGQFTRDDLATSQAEWVEPVAIDAWGHTIHSTPPPSQGYLTLAGAAVAGGLGLPDDPDDPAWAHALAEACRVTGADRDQRLHDDADARALLDPERLAQQRSLIDPDRRAAAVAPTRTGGTTVACAVDRERMGVTLIQSNASGWGAHIVEPSTGVFLHDRGIGFTLDDGHPAMWAAGRRPPHTLAPALVTRPDGSLRAVLGTMGGDSQPQILVQLLARVLRNGESPGQAVRAGRWVLGRSHPGGQHGGFDTWSGDGPDLVSLEAHAPAAWDAGLVARGHDVRRSTAAVDHGFGHAQLIEVIDGVLAGIADPRSLDGAAAGY